MTTAASPVFEGLERRAAAGRGATRSLAGVGGAGGLAAPEGRAASRLTAGQLTAGRHRAQGLSPQSHTGGGGGVCGISSHGLRRAAGSDEAAQRHRTDSRWPEGQFMWHRWVGLGKAWVKREQAFGGMWSHVDIQSWTHMYGYTHTFTFRHTNAQTLNPVCTYTSRRPQGRMGWSPSRAGAGAGIISHEAEGKQSRSIDNSKANLGGQGSK